MPSYSYRLSWQLESEQDYLKRTFSATALERYFDVLSVPSTDKLREELGSDLSTIVETTNEWKRQGLLEEPLLDSSVTLRLYLVVEDITSDFGNQCDAVYVELAPYAP